MNPIATKNLQFLLENVLKNHSISDLKMEKFKKGTVIIEEGNEINSIYFMIHGKTKIYKEYENGKTLLIQFVNGLSFMGDAEYILGLNQATGSVEAVTDVILFRLLYVDLHNKYDTSNEFKDYMMKHIINRFMTSDKKTMINLMYPVETRLSSYLLSVANEKSQITLENIKDLANNIGTSYRHIHRILRKFCDDKIIKKNNNEVTIINLQEIKKLARGNVYEDSYEEKGY